MFYFYLTFVYYQGYADIIQTVCVYCCNLGFFFMRDCSVFAWYKQSEVDSTKQTLYFPYSLLFTPIVLLVLTMSWSM